MAKNKLPHHTFSSDPVPVPVDKSERAPLTGWWGGREATTIYNPDDLVSRKGLEIYEKMGNDEQVFAALQAKKLARLSTGWDLIAASDDPKDREVRDFVAAVVNTMPGAWDSKLLEFMSALQYGFSVAEKLWTVETAGRWAGKVVLRDVKIKSPFGFRFVVDQFGNITANGIELVTLGVGGQARLQRDKFAIWSYNALFQNPYGKSDLRTAYRSWFSKDFIIKYFNIHIERFASPTAICHVPDHLSPEEVESLRTLMKNLQNQTSATIPDGVTLQYLESKLGGAISFRFADAIDMHNRFMARAILVPDMMGYSGDTKGGSFALGKKQVDVFFMILSALGRELEERVVGEQIIRPLVDLNFPGVTNYPRFRFRDVVSDLDVKTKIMKVLFEAGAIDPSEDWVRPYLNIPTRTLPPPEADVFTAMEGLRTTKGFILSSLICPACHQRFFADFVYDRHCLVGYHPDCIAYFGECARAAGRHRDGFYAVRIRRGGHYDVKPWTRAHLAPPPHANGNGDVRALVEALVGETSSSETSTEEVLEPFVEKSAERKATALEWATRFKRIDKTFNGLATSTAEAARPVFSGMKEKLLGAVRRKQIVANRDLRGVDAAVASVNVGAFQKLLAGMYMTMAGNGALEGAMELSRKLGRRAFAVFAEGNGDPVTTPLAADVAIKTFSKKKVYVGKVLVRIDLSGFLEAFFRERAFLFAGIEKDHITQQAKTILGTAIRQGDPRLAEEQIAAIFDEYLPAGEARPKPARLWAVLETGLGEAFNEGRRLIFEHADLKDRIVGYQWSAVLDGRTSEYCASMHGKVFRKEQIETLLPPAHLHCRSTVIAVTDGESFAFTDRDPLSPRAGVSRQAGFTENPEAQVWTEEQTDILWNQERRQHVAEVPEPLDD